MRKYLYSLLFTGLILTSCEDFTDIEQVGRLGSDEAFQTTSDLVLGNLGVYDNFDYTPMIQFNSVFTDQVSVGPDNGGQGLGGDFAFVLNSNSGAPAAIWANGYAAVNAATRVILASESITPEEGEEDDYRNAVAVSHALRAWANFELLTYFSPDLTDDSSPGVIILDFIPETDTELPRSTTGEVFQFIEDDLEVAANNIVEISNTTFVSEDFIKALRARIALYRGNYAAADALAAELLTDYPLATRAEYPGIFTDASESEVIFKLERTIGDNYDGQGLTGSPFAGGWAGANFAFVNSGINGGVYFEMSKGLFNELDANDIRYDVLVEPSSVISENLIFIGKYQGSEGQPLMNDLKIFRSSEMLFIRAEAAAEANDLVGAAGFIEELLDARYATDQAAPVFASQEDAFATILEQRRIELAYEGFRWVDYKRLGPKAGISGIVRNTEDCEVSGSQCNLTFPDVRLNALPIPLNELDVNGEMEQTPGY